MIVKLIDRLCRDRSNILLATTTNIFVFSGFNAKIDYFQILGVSPRASEQEVKSAYHSKAKQFHPDVNPQLEDQFKLINEAYRILSDSNLRRQYIKIHESTGQQAQISTSDETRESDKSSGDPLRDMIKTHLRYFHTMKKQTTNSHISHGLSSRKISNKQNNQRQGVITNSKYWFALFGIFWMILVGEILFNFRKSRITPEKPKQQKS